jgi:hypothetical protein
MTAGASLAHVVTELRRLDLMVRIQAWRVRVARGDDPGIPGLVVRDDEVDALLDRPLGAPPWAEVALPDDVRAAVQAELDELAGDAAARERAADDAGEPLRLPRLARLFGLSRFDVDVLLACLAPELDTRYRRLYGWLHDDLTRRRPSVDLVLMLLEPDPAPPGRGSRPLRPRRPVAACPSGGARGGTRPSRRGAARPDAGAGPADRGVPAR